MFLRPRSKKFTKKERLSLQSNHGEALLGYKWIAPFDDGINKEGLTKEQVGPLIIYHLNSREKHDYLMRLVNKGEKVMQPAMSVPVFLSTANIPGNSDRNEWTIRTFRLDFAEVFEKKHWYSLASTLVIKDYLQLFPDISSYQMPEDSVPEQIIRHWENLDQKSVTMEDLRKLLGLPAENKTA